MGLFSKKPAGKKIRIAFARIQQETNALSPVRTTVEDFEQMYLVGDELLRAVSPGGYEVKGFFKRAELAGFIDAVRARNDEVEAVPIFSAWASSNGPWSNECFETLKQRLIDGLQAARKHAPLDGGYISLHGAAGVDGVLDPETEIIKAAKLAAGNVPVVVSHDLHANLTKERVEAATAIVGYRTNPHRDFAAVGKRAGEILIRTVLHEVKPTVAWRTLPMILGGGKTLDFMAPMRKVFQRMKQMEKDPKVLSVTTYMVHPFNSHPALGWSTYVVTDNNPALAEKLADELAEMAWECRHEQPPPFSTASEAIAKARAATLRRKVGVVMMADASDVVTAGAPGDSTHLMRALLNEAQGLLTYIGVRDPAAVQELWRRRAGDAVELSIGGKLDPSRSQPLAVRGTVVSKHNQQGFLRTVVLAVEHLRIVITEGPSMSMRPAFYAKVGLPIAKADIVVVKNFFPFLMFFAPFSRMNIFVTTHGTTDFDAAFSLTFDGPVHPRDVVTEWRTRDRMRRGVG